MEEPSNRMEPKSLLKGSGSLKSALSGRSSPHNSPSFRRLQSGRIPRKEVRGSGCTFQWFRNNRVLFWLFLITLWTYLGFYVQSRWAHSNHRDSFLGFRNRPSNVKLDVEQNQRRDLLSKNDSLAVKNGSIGSQVGHSKMIDKVLGKKVNGASSNRKLNSKKRNKRNKRKRSVHGKASGKKKMMAVVVENVENEELELDIPKTNSSYRMLVGPFGLTEDRILEWSPEKRSGTCYRKGDFARLAWSRKFVLVFHELSMTGAPLSMMELATELLSCGATVSAVVLSKKGGLMSELTRRRIKVLEDKADQSFKTARNADLVIAGSAVCASWIDQFIEHHPAGASQVAWWIMENRREYFNRAKVVLDRVKILVFLSESQSKQWLNWCDEENIKLRSQPALVPLSINDELAFVAGIASTLNTPSFSTSKMLEKRQLLRDSVRKDMGLADNNMLVMSLSSINPGKGQLLLLESARLMIKKETFQDDPKIKKSVEVAQKHPFRTLFQMSNGSVEYELAHGKKVMSHGAMQDQSVKILMGSIGSKSNKVVYVKEILRFLSDHSNLSKSVLWTPATTHVAALYSAADVYVINSQGLGETFGRVTIEAMAFGLPVLGTEAGGTKEIVDHNMTGLLHPTGRPGISVLAQNLQFLLENPSARKQMGMKGRDKVQKMYLKRHMYRKFVDVLVKCMRPK